MAGGVHGTGRVWQGACVAGGVCGRGHAWPGVCDCIIGLLHRVTSV